MRLVDFLFGLCYNILYIYYGKCNGMLLTMDIGNTCITLGIFKGQELVCLIRLSTDRDRTGDQYAVDLKNQLELNGLSPTAFDGAILSSVVPALVRAMKQAVKKVLGIEALSVGPGTKTSLNIRIDNPAQLGADLVAGAVAAIDKYPLPCIIFDLGTANTISVLNEKGEFLGGTISAGMGISLDALASRTSQLPYVGLDAPDKVIGSNTISSMKSGLIYGTAAMMDGMADRIERELKKKATLVATGGRAAQVVEYCQRDVILDSELLLHGLRLIYEKNKKS